MHADLDAIRVSVKEQRVFCHRNTRSSSNSPYFWSGTAPLHDQRIPGETSFFLLVLNNNVESLELRE